MSLDKDVGHHGATFNAIKCLSAQNRRVNADVAATFPAGIKLGTARRFLCDVRMTYMNGTMRQSHACNNLGLLKKSSIP